MAVPLPVRAGMLIDSAISAKAPRTNGRPTSAQRVKAMSSTHRPPAASSAMTPTPSQLARVRSGRLRYQPWDTISSYICDCTIFNRELKEYFSSASVVSLPEANTDVSNVCS